jgi:hypothetical protein
VINGQVKSAASERTVFLASGNRRPSAMKLYDATLVFFIAQAGSVVTRQVYSVPLSLPFEGALHNSRICQSDDLTWLKFEEPPILGLRHCSGSS